MSVFAEDGDHLWTPRPVDVSRVGDALPRVLLESGPPERLATFDEAIHGTLDETIAWGQESEVAARVNHRAFGLSVAESLGVALPGAAYVRSMDELLARAPEGEWVGKAPHSAAGRLRVRGRGRSPAPAVLARAERLLDAFGGLLVEPWLTRTADFGVSAVTGPEGVEVLGVHGLEVDGGGRFSGVAFPPAKLRRLDEDLLREVAIAAGHALRSAGYTGPFGIDAFLWRDDRGVLRLDALSEINARLTFGRIAFELSRRLASGATSFALRFGAGAPPPGSIPLILPAHDDASCAWADAGDSQ